NHDILGLLFNQSGQNLDKVFRLINHAEKGAVVFISKDLSPMDILGKLQELKNLQLTANQNSTALKMDDKDFGIGAQILHDLNIHKIKLISNSQEKKRVGMIGYGLEIVEYVGY
ncbi:MAG: bifunctional 3,4-dihydroxy-2-butanone-4-phosphate synthase/GTP cyclohydrolase II, partial [Flavobacteriaceae bacterium]|nr:bifunctional 3,4-dihydroxy-2-butanone-4-phosphate synthase/GTP cyclohydrolase II [Flavobacteriaceae bacterium]